MAALWKLPIVFVCENNQWAMSLPWSNATAEPSFALKAQGYGMPGIEVDGQDVLAVRRAALEAIERARGGDGPTLLGVQTYRFLGHSRGDPSPYRDKDEEARQRARDTLRLFQDFLFRENVIGQDDVDAIEAEITNRLDAAVQFAEAGPPATIEDALASLYA